MTATNDIALHGASLEAGERIRIVCPVCGGGSAKEKSMDISRTDEGNIIWNCHRGSCDGSSGGKGGGNLVRTRHEPRKQSMNPYRGDVVRLEDEQCNFLCKKIGWTEEHIGMGQPRWAPDEECYAFPIFGPMGLRRGYVLRNYAGGTQTKARTRMDEAEPHMSWYRHRGSPSTVVVVEDIPSAVRAAKYVNAIALCGTGCGPDYAQEIQAHAPNVVWALDADATNLALRLHREYSLLFLTSRVQPLAMDLKDMAEVDLAKLLGGSNEPTTSG
jgi:hypothetical protein